MNIKVTGEIIDYIYKNSVLVKEVRGHNLILNSFNKMFFAILNGEALDPNSSDFYFIIGSGKESWDSDMPSPEKSERYLETPIGAVRASHFIVNKDTGNDYVSYTANFPQGTLNGTWREFGIAYTVDSNITPVFVPKPYSPYYTDYYLLDKYHHPVIEKTNDISIQRVLNFKFTIS